MVDSGASKTFNSTFLHELALNHLSIRISESVYEVKYYRSLIAFNRKAVSVKVYNLKLFGLEKLIDLSGETRYTFDYVLAEYLVHVISKVRNPESLDVRRIDWMC